MAKRIIELDKPLIGICAGFNNILRAIGTDVIEDKTGRHNFYDIDYVVLNDGEELLRKVIESTKEEYISGEDAFKLYDTYGFPIELTEEIVKESNKLVDIKRFKELLLEQKERARASREKTKIRSYYY